MAQIPVVDLLSGISQRCRDAPIPTLIDAYVRAARDFCRKSRWLIAEVAGATTIGDTLYALGSDPYVEIIGLRALTFVNDQGKTDPVRDSVSSSWDTDDEPGPPEFYQYVPEGQFALHPAPDAIYDLTITLILQPKRGVNSIDTTLPVKWERTLEKGALAFLLNLRDVTWSDPREAAELKRQFNVDCASALLNAARGYNPGALPSGDTGARTGALRSRSMPF